MKNNKMDIETATKIIIRAHEKWVRLRDIANFDFHSEKMKWMCQEYVEDQTVVENWNEDFIPLVYESEAEVLIHDKIDIFLDDE
jgi:hypothetical protein